MACECPHERTITELAFMLPQLLEGQKRIDVKIDDIIDRMAAVKLLEAEHSHTRETTGRLFNKVEDVEATGQETAKKLDEIIAKGKGAATLGSVVWSAVAALAGLVGWATSKLHG